MLEKQAFVPGTAAVAPAHVCSGNVLAWQTLLMLLPCCYCAFSKQHVRLKRHALMQEAGVQAYFAGHDHNLEHIHASNSTPHYIISVAGARVTDHSLALQTLCSSGPTQALSPLSCRRMSSLSTSMAMGQGQTILSPCTQ